jgi:cell division protein FtsQ
MVRYIKIILTWTIVVAYLLVIPGFTLKKNKDQVCNNIHINISDSINNRFVSKYRLYKLLTTGETPILGTRFGEINTSRLEESIESLPEVLNAEFYKTVNGVLHVEISQRKPLIRVMGDNIKGFYLDKEGEVIPLSDHYTADVIIANGKIPAYFSIRDIQNVHQFEGEEKERHAILLDLFDMALYFNENEFWKAQIEQVYVNQRDEFELVPRVGAHLIILGDAEGFAKKLKKLYALYHVGFDHVGWNDYEIINLKYKNQVVCTKR